MSEQEYEKIVAEISRRISESRSAAEAWAKDPMSVLKKAGVPESALAMKGGAPAATAMAGLGAGAIAGAGGAAEKAKEKKPGQGKENERDSDALPKEAVRAVAHWWGFELLLTHTAVQNVNMFGGGGGSAFSGTVAAVLTGLAVANPVFAPFAAAAGLVAAALGGKAFELAVADGWGHHKGVAIPFSWPQIAAIASAGPIAPAALAIAALVIHPGPANVGD